MNSKWFWGIISIISTMLLLVFSIRIITYGNADIPLFSQFLILYDNTDFGGSFVSIYRDFIDFINDYLYLENFNLLKLEEYQDISAWYDIFAILYNIGILIVNIFTILVNVVYTLIVTVISAVLNAFNVIYELARILIVLLQFTLGIVP